MPAVFYGKKQASTPISVPANQFMKAWKHAGESEVVSLTGEKGSVSTLIHDVAVDALTGVPLHADFYVFEKGQKMEIDIPLEFVGVAPAVKDLNGNLVKVMHEIKISASPEHLPHVITVDVSSLATFDDHITAKDIILPSGVSLVEDPESIVVSVSGPKAEEVDEPTVAPDLSAIEVEKKGKKEEEGDVQPEAEQNKE